MALYGSLHLCAKVLWRSTIPAKRNGNLRGLLKY